ncbi:hypothetical protein GOBAR_AA14544 [Gossypium barbadense]|uniref:Zinc knuckle CX2CX4HX4C domain-containing protein n=1 Tax=Gossypium barbadense TaxID=3634 RepID=A0A2P5XS36_GOSBA|nr:hypothetical protein GOBAR_AA14544 [Gossypium barbadense]
MGPFEGPRKGQGREKRFQVEEEFDLLKGVAKKELIYGTPSITFSDQEGYGPFSANTSLAIGLVAKIDWNIDSKSRGQIAILAVYIDFGKPMVSKILIEGRIQCVEYESLSLVCFGYGRFGHVRESCSYNFERDETMEKLESVNLGKTSKSEEKSNEDLFGPWMLVERRKPQTFKSTTIKSSGINGGTMVRRSKFEVLNVDQGELDGSTATSLMDDIEN